MVRIAICEDDVLYLEKEQQLINDFFKKEDISLELTTYKSGLDLIKSHKEDYDIIFLDISDEEMDGLETARTLRENGTKAYIVFLTAYVEYSLEGYKLDAHRCLLKNADDIEDTLHECLASALDKIQKEKKIELDVQGGILTIAPSKIVYAESNVHKVTIYVLDNSENIREYYMYDRLDHVQEELAQFGFMRIHQSYLINSNYLRSVCRYTAELDYNINLGISKKYYKALEDYYIRMRGEL